MASTHIHTALGLLSLVLLLSACGFHLRGGVDLPESLLNVQLEGVAEYSDLGVAVRNSLSSSGGRIVKQAATGDSILHILQERFERRVLSVNAQGKPNEYELKYIVDFKVSDSQGKTVLAKQQISMLRDYRFDADNVLAKGDEETRIKKEMLRAAVARMMRRISIGMQNTGVEAGIDTGPDPHQAADQIPSQIPTQQPDQDTPAEPGAPVSTP